MRLIAATCVWLAAMAAPALAADAAVDVVNFSFTPSVVSIDPGDSVTWTFSSAGNHSITAGDGSFDSDPMNPLPAHPMGFTYVRMFPGSGCFLYHCKVHASMTGRVIVGGAACPPPPDTGGGPAPGPSPGGGTGTGPQADTAPPAFASVRVRSRRIRFKLSEPARVTGSVRKGRRRVQAISLAGRKGANAVRLSRHVGPGRYRLSLKAVDAAGNVSRAISAGFRVRP